MSDPVYLYNSLSTMTQCLPASSLFAAINVTHVDLFILDVEKVETKILQNFPFDKVSVDVWAIEHQNWSEDSKFAEFMINKGYYYFDVFCNEVPDYIFVRKASELYKSLNVPAEAENRTAVCPYKPYRTRQNYTSSVELLRDLHHYPTLPYKDIPLVEILKEGEEYKFARPFVVDSKKAANMLGYGIV